MENMLAKGVVQLGFELEENVQARMLDYIVLLAKWNRTYNLTAVRDPVQMVTRHLLDSLSVLTYLNGKSVLDIGSGAGLPGIPLSLCMPDLDFVLLDSNGKKTRFMTHAVKELGLQNVTVVKSRVEDYKTNEKYDTIISRAFSSLANLLDLSQHLCSDTGKILAMKGTYPLAEVDEIPDSDTLVNVIRLDIPGSQAERHLAIIDCSKIQDLKS